MGIFGQLQHLLARRAVRRQFAAVRCAGLEHLRALPTGKPGILCPIHTSWWDGFFVACLFPHVPGRVFRLAQQQMHLDRYPWFRAAGVLGLDAGSPGKLRASFGRLVECLREPAVLLVFFPQGRLTIQDAGPIQARPGIGRLAAASGAPVFPVIWRHGLRDGARPELWMRVGPALAADGEAMAAEWERAMREMEATLAGEWARGETGGFVPLFPPRAPINERWLAWKHRFSGRSAEAERKDPS